MPELARDIIALVLTPVVIIGALAYILKNIFSQVLDRDIEYFKARLQSERDRDLEQFKSLIRERELRASRLHEQHVLILSELFSRICEARKEVQTFVSTRNWSDEATRSQAYQKVASKVRNAEDYFVRNRIWLSKKLCRQIQQILNTHGWKLLVKANFLLDMDQNRTMEAWVGEKKGELWQQIEDKIPTALELLEEEFRQILGVDSQEMKNEE